MANIELEQFKQALAEQEQRLLAVLAQLGVNGGADAEVPIPEASAPLARTFHEVRLVAERLAAISEDRHRVEELLRQSEQKGRSEHTRMEQLARDVLELLNCHHAPSHLMRDILHAVKKHMGVDAVGLRLRWADDFPYYETNGLPEDFVRAERSLCVRNETGEIVRDTQGNAVLECMCGDIIRGRTDPTSPFFTQGGSFWTNSTTDFLAATTAAGRQSRARGRCNGEGYESEALIPLRSGGEMIGLLQLADHRRDQLDVHTIEFLEGVVASIGIGYARQRDAAEQLRLKREIVSIAERGRIEVGHELHDRVCQLLTAAVLRCDLLRLAGVGGEIDHLRLLRELVEQARDEAHRLAQGLVPTDPADLRLDEVVREVCDRFGMEHELRMLGDPGIVDAQIARQLRDICQEALSNAARHGAARRVTVVLEILPDELRLTVDDDGCGLVEGSPAGIGLRTMERRAHSLGGSLALTSRPGGGTRLQCAVPLTLGQGGNP